MRPTIIVLLVHKVTALLKKNLKKGYDTHKIISFLVFSNSVKNAKVLLLKAAHFCSLVLWPWQEYIYFYIQEHIIGNEFHAECQWNGNRIYKDHIRNVYRTGTGIKSLFDYYWGVVRQLYKLVLYSKETSPKLETTCFSFLIHFLQWQP